MLKNILLVCRVPGRHNARIHAINRASNPIKFKADGAQGRIRTTDTAIFSRMLYQLSYLGAR